jgi:hypothetical protein
MSDTPGRISMYQVKSALALVRRTSGRSRVCRNFLRGMVFFSLCYAASFCC